MSTKDRSIARTVTNRPPVPAMVPDHIRAGYADALTRIPCVRLDIRRPAPSRPLPEVGSFYG